jgi:hypothetical protein
MRLWDRKEAGLLKCHAEFIGRRTTSCGTTWTRAAGWFRSGIIYYKKNFQGSLICSNKKVYQRY